MVTENSVNIYKRVKFGQHKYMTNFRSQFMLQFINIQEMKKLIIIM